MNKAEKAAFRAVQLRAALGWPAPPPSPVDISVALEIAHAETGKRRYRGWLANPNRMDVEPGGVIGGSHYRGEYSDEKIDNRYRPGNYVPASQTTGGPWYATKADAYRALHWAVAEECAKRLLQIEEALASHATTGDGR